MKVLFRYIKVGVLLLLLERFGLDLDPLEQMVLEEKRRITRFCARSFVMGWEPCYEDKSMVRNMESLAELRYASVLNRIR